MLDQKENAHQWYLDNIGITKERSRLWAKNNPEKMKENRRRRYKNNPEYIRQYYQEHREEKLEYIKRYRQEHKEERNRYERNKRRTDLKANINHKISNEIYDTLKRNKGGRHWEILVGYKVSDLVRHLKKTMPKGYTWQDYMVGKLHIDHIVPISVFNYEKPEHTDFKKCWSLNNLQLLPASINISKGNKLTEPFQPALQYQF